jgi:3-deoxy-7-phosphoheptulonate synthase
VVLRGGRARTNYDAASIADAVAQLRKHNLPAGLMVDCSHANSLKQHAKQEEVWQSLIAQRAEGNTDLIGAMIESNLQEGSQPVGDNPAALKYGVSVTDACIGWETTERLLRWGRDQLAKSGAPRQPAAGTHAAR